MNIQNFEEYMDGTILRRGKDYFSCGCITSLEREDDIWVAEVAGRDDYEVTVALAENGNILDTGCDCPYDQGMYCKPQAAVFYSLEKMNPAALQASPKKENLESLLGNLQKSELIQLLLDYAEYHREIRTDLRLKLSQAEDVLEPAGKMIKMVIRKHCDDGYVAYGDAPAAVSGAGKTLSMAKNDTRFGPVIRVKLCVIVLEEMAALLEHCDTSDGYVEDVLSEAIECIDGIIFENQGSAEIFTAILEFLKNGDYFGWGDWPYELLDILLPFCHNPDLRQKYLDYLHKGIKPSPKNIMTGILANTWKGLNTNC